MTDLAKLVVTLEAQAGKFQKDLEKANKKLDRFGKNAKKSVDTAKLAFAGLALGALTKKVVDATSEQERAYKQLEQGIKSTNQAVGFSAQQLAAYATELQTVTTFGDENIIAAQAKLVTFTKVTGDEFKRTTELALDMSARFGTDVSSSAIQLGKALNDPVANLSALSRAGIQFSSDQKAVIKALVDSGRQVDAQKIILKELEVQFGGSARAARDTFGGALTALGNSFGDLLESNGGLKESQIEIEALTKQLADPKTKAAAQQLTGVLISGFSNLVSIMAQVPDFAKFLGESIAAAIHGPADLIRINDKLDSSIKALEEATLRYDSARYEQRKSISLHIRSLNKEISALKEKKKAIEDAQNATAPSLNLASNNTGDLTASPQAAPELSLVGGSDVDVAQMARDMAQLQVDAEAEVKALAAEKKAEDELLAHEEKLLRLEEQFATESEFLAAQRDSELALLDDHRSKELLGAKRHTDLKLKIEKDYARTKQQLDRQKANMEIEQAAFAAHSVLGILGAFAGSSVKATKALAIAEGIINIAAGVSKALNNPYPANLGFAAQVAAQGAALLSTIKGTNLGSSGGSVNVSSSAAAPNYSTPAAATQVQTAEQTAAAVAHEQSNYQSGELGFTIQINNPSFNSNDSQKLMDDFVTGLESATINPNSRFVQSIKQEVAA